MEWLRSWLRQWVGVEGISQACVDLNGEMSELENRVREEYRRDMRMHLNVLNSASVSQDKRIESIQEALSFRITTLEDQLKQLREGLLKTEVVVDKPLMCPAGHTGITMVVPIAHFDVDDPSKSEVVGGGFYCPKCGSNFYADRHGRWLPAEAAAPAGEMAPPVQSANNAGPKLRTRRGE